MKNTYYRDADGDGYGDPSDSVQGCAPPTGYVIDSSDNCPSDPEKIDPGICGCGSPDTDNEPDGMIDCWEIANGLDPNVDDANLDPDNDGFSNLIEYKRGTDPQDPNSHPSKAMPWLPLLLGD